jgi:hypothetical protein
MLVASLRALPIEFLIKLTGNLEHIQDIAYLFPTECQPNLLGYAATSLDDLMRVTGLGKGSTYGAFGDKPNFFFAVLKVYADERVVHAQEALNSDKPAIERLRALFSRSAPL